MIARLAAVKRGEEGAALVLALAFVTLFGLWIGSVLTLSATEATVTVRARTIAADEYEADAAIEQAIAYMRPNLEMGRSGQRTWQCGSVTNAGTSTLSTAACAAGSGGTITSNGTDNPTNHPARAILALGTSASENEIDHSAASALSVHGAIYSQGNVTNNASPAMNVEGDVTAKGTCAGSIVSVMPPTHCSDSTTVSDPSYLGSITTPSGKTPPAACPTSPAWLLDFEPGYYDDATLLNTLAACTGSVLWFEPGTYVFDFQNTGTHVWTVNLPASSNLVGGTEKGWANGGGAGSKPSISFPGGCKTGFDATPNTGVQFVFGGDSQLNVTGGKVELCATPSASSQQIAMYGLKTTSSTSIGPSTLSTNAVVASSGPWTATASATGPADGVDADVTATSNGETDTLTLGTYSDFRVPLGSTITSATVSFTHNDESNVQSVGIVITPGDGSGACTSIAGTVSNSSHTNTTANLASTCLSSAEKINDVTVLYGSVSVSNKKQKAHLDSVVLNITYTAIAHAQSGCTITTGYPSSGCAMLKTTGGSLAVQGTVYAPNAALDVTLASVNYTVFARGVIARMFKSAIASSDSTKDAVVVPDDCPYATTGASNLSSCATGTRTDRVLTIYDAIGSTACDATPSACKLVAKVLFQDGTTTSGTCSAPGSQTAITPGRQVTVCEWSVNR